MCLFCCPPLCLEPFLYFVGKSEWTKAFCFCMDSKKYGAVWSSYFTGATSIINLIINIWLLATLHYLDGYLEDHEKWNFIPPGIIPLMYIELIFNLVLLFLAFVLMVGVNRGYEGKGLMYIWMWYFGGMRWYEVFMGIYILVWLGGHRIPDVVFICPQSLFIAAYWLINNIILIYCIVTVHHYYKECNREMFGKEKRVRYFKMLSNIRSAALSKSQSIFSGAATPRSAFMSRTQSLAGAQSQGSLSEGLFQPAHKQPRSVLPSTASQASYAGPPRGMPPPSAPPPGDGRGYPPPPDNRGYPPPQRGYPPPQQGGYPPPQQAGYPPPPQGGYPPPPQGGFPPPGQPQRQGYQPPAMSGLAKAPQYPGAGR